MSKFGLSENAKIDKRKLLSPELLFWDNNFIKILSHFQTQLGHILYLNILEAQKE